jgi:hypothetical protein
VEKGYRETQRMARIEPMEKLGIRLQTWRNEARAEWEEFMRTTSGIVTTSSYEARARVAWESAEGVPGTREWAELYL